jgi:hypothetical protein
MTETTTTTRKINRAVLALSHLAASDESRPVLANVYIKDQLASAADGFIAGWVTLPETDPAERVTGEAFVPAKAALKALRKASAKEPGVTMESNGTRHLLIADRNEEEPIAARVDPQMEDATFPDVQRITPTSVPQATTTLSVDILKQLVAYFEQGMGDNGGKPVEVRVHGPHAATEWRAVSADGSHMTALAMPMVIGHDGDGWLFDPVDGVARDNLGAGRLRETLAHDRARVIDELALSDHDDRMAILDNVLSALGFDPDARVGVLHALGDVGTEVQHGK